MSKLIETVNNLSEEQKNIFSKYLGIMPICEHQIDEKLEFATSKGIMLVTLKGLVRYLAMDLEEIKRRYDIYEKSGYVDLITNAPELIRFNPDTILERISICQKVGKPFKVDDKYADYLFDDQLWKAVEQVFEQEEDYAETSVNEYQDINPAEWMKDDQDNIISDALKYSGQIDFDLDSYDKYNKIKRLVQSVREVAGIKEDVMSLPIPEDELISRLIIKYPTMSEKEVARYCLEYCYGLVDGIDSIIDTISENIISEEKRGL